MLDYENPIPKTAAVCAGRCRAAVGVDPFALIAGDRHGTVMGGDDRQPQETLAQSA